MEPVHQEEAEPAGDGAWVEVVLAVAGWEARVLAPDPVGAVSARNVAQEHPIRWECHATRWTVPSAGRRWSEVKSMP
jgi:hypothetical protein